MFTKILALFALMVGTAQAAYFPTFSINNFNQFGIYNSTLPVLTDGGRGQIQLNSNSIMLVDDQHLSDWATLLLDTGSIDSKTPALGQTTMAGSSPVTIASDQTPLDVNIVTPISVSNPSIGANGAAIPTSSTQVAGEDPSNNLQPLQVTAAKDLKVDVQASALPAGASTAANQATANASLANIETNTTGVSTAANQTNGSQQTQIVQGGNTATVTASNALKVDGSGSTQPVSGTVTVTQATGANLHTVVDSSALPAGAATSANQTTANTSLGNIDTSTSAINGKLANNYGVATGAIRVAAQIGNASAVADFGAGNSSTQTIRTVIATDQSAVATKSPVNNNGSTTTNTISAVTTITAPANAVEVIIQADDTNTANLRFAINATATTSTGIQLQPGRSETLKIGSNISIIPESGTQKYNVIWITQ